MGHNERLEFLGDRVLGLIIADMLLDRFPHEQEGEIAQRYAALVRTETLERVAKDLQLDRYIHMSWGEEQNGGRKNTSLLANVCEAVIAALYKDCGIDGVRMFLEKKWAPIIEEYILPPKDPKTTLQEWVQGEGYSLPAYKETGRSGPDHSPLFTVEVSVKDHEAATGTGHSKQHAEQAAAASFLKRNGF